LKLQDHIRNKKAASAAIIIVARTPFLWKILMIVDVVPRRYTHNGYFQNEYTFEGVYPMIRSYRGNWVAALIMGIALLLPPLSVLAADEVPPEVISSSVTPRVVAYKGNTTAGYTTVSIKTNEPTRGYVRVEGMSRITRINLSTTVYKSEHVVNWIPWDDTKREPLPPGNYTLKLELQDQGLNAITGYPLGTLTVVSESNPKALVDGVAANPAEVSPKYNVNESLTTIHYQLNRHAEVQVVLRKDGVEYFHGPKEKLAPGQYSLTWNGRNDAGNIVPDGNYEIVFKTIELNYNYPANQPTIEVMGSVTVKDGEYDIPQWRLKEIVTGGGFDSATVTPNDDGNQDQVNGHITLAENAQVSVWIANEAGAHVKQVLPLQSLSAGTHTFAWDGKDAWGGHAPNGTYFVKVQVLEKEEVSGYLVIDGAQVKVQDSYQITVPEPQQRVRVITPTTRMSVYPMDQGYTGKQGDIFPIIQFQSDADSYEVLVKEGVTGRVKVSDVEMIDLSSIPEKWGKVTRDGVEVRTSPASSYVLDRLSINTELRILRQDGNWYRVMLSSGKQAYVSVNDMTIVEKSTSGNGTNNGQSVVVHVVQSGDTLWKIAQKYGVTLDALVKANNLDPNKYLAIGQKLVIPVANTNPATIHVVQSGDTLWKIAQKYGITLDALVKANNLDPNKYLAIGQKLVIPVANTNPATIHVVQSGDSLWKIAQKYGVTLDALVKANNLDPNKYLAIGQKLTIPNK
jgi:LysM repeat protein/flagellar hook assembly protein FlgD